MLAPGLQAVILLAATLGAVVATGGLASPLVPLVPLPPILLGLRRGTARAALGLAVALTAAVLVLLAVGLDAPPAPIDRVAVALATAAALALGYGGGRLLWRRVIEADRLAVAAQRLAVAAAEDNHKRQLGAVAAYAHELKNPLAAMLGLATLMRRRAATEPAHAEALEGLAADVQGMSRSVHALLDFSRPLAPGALVKVELAALVADALTLAAEGLAAAPRAVVRVPAGIALLVEPRKAQRLLAALVRPALAAGMAPEITAREDEAGVVTLVVAAPGSVPEAIAETRAAAALAAQHDGSLTVVAAPYRATLRLAPGEVSWTPESRSAAAPLVDAAQGRTPGTAEGQLVQGIMSLLMFSGAALFGLEGWRVAATLPLVLVVVALAIHDVRRGVGQPDRFLAALQLSLVPAILLCGALATPLMPALVSVTAVGAIVSGARRFSVVLLGAAAVALLGAALLELVAPRWLLDCAALDREHAGLGRVVGSVAMVLMVMNGCVRGAMYVGFVRRAIDGAVAVEALAHSERLASATAARVVLEELTAALRRELAAPLARVIQRADALAAVRPDDPAWGERFVVVAREARRLEALIARSAERASDLAQVDVPRLLGELATANEALADARGARLVIAPTAVRALVTRETPLRQILTNLVQNAIEASPPGGAVTLGAAADGGAVVLRVDDEGPGLAPAVQARLFARGFTTKPQGSGIGLATARALAGELGATLALRNRDGGGCRATLVVPRGEAR